MHRDDKKMETKGVPKEVDNDNDDGLVIEGSVA